MSDDEFGFDADRLAEGLFKVLAEVFNQMAGQAASDVFMEVHEGEKETIVLLEIPGLAEEDLKFEIFKKKDIPHNEMPGDYKVLHLTTHNIEGKELDIGVKIPKKLKKVKNFSVRNGVVEVTLV